MDSGLGWALGPSCLLPKTGVVFLVCCFMVTFCNCLGLQLPARIYVWHEGDLLAFFIFTCLHSRSVTSDARTPSSEHALELHCVPAHSSGLQRNGN